MPAPIPTPLRAQLSPTSLSRSASFPIRAPLSSGDNGSDADSLSTADDGFETASDADEPIPDPIIAARVPGMPIAQLTGDDDVDEEDDMFEDVIEDEIDGEAIPAIARIPVAGGSDSSDGEVSDLEEPIESEDLSGLIVGESKINVSHTVEMANDEHTGHDEVLPDLKSSESVADFNHIGVESPAGEEIGSRDIERETAASDVGDSKSDNEVGSSLIAVEGLGSKEAERETTESGTSDFVSVEEVESSRLSAEGSESMETERKIKETSTIPMGENSNVVPDIEEEEGTGKEVSVGEVESPPIIVEEMGGGETGCSSMAGDANSSVVLHETLTSESASGMDEKILADTPKLAVDYKDLVSVQEVESPDIPSKESEIVADVPELTLDHSDFVSDQEVESPIMPSKESKIVADMPELAANSTDVVSVQEVESPIMPPQVMPSEETKIVIDTPELAANYTNVVSIQEVGSPLPSKESEIVDAPELAPDDGNFVSVQEIESNITPFEESKIAADMPELAANDTDLVSESFLIPSKESKTFADMPELAANDTEVVSVQEVESLVTPSEEAKTVVEIPELAAKDTNLVSVQEVELLVTPSEEAETVVDTPELAAKDTNLISVQEVELPIMPSEESKTVADTCNSAANDTDLVPVQEIESPPILSEDSETVINAPELATDTSSLVSVQEVESLPTPFEESETVANVLELAADDSGLVSAQEIESSLTPEESEMVARAPELAVYESDTISVQEVELPPLSSEESETVATVAHAPELAADDSGLVSAQEVESSLTLEESEMVAHAPELAVDESDTISIQEVESPPLSSVESETVAHAPELAAGDSGLALVQEVESSLAPSEELEIVAHVPELAANDNGLVSVQEVDSPLIPSEESETVAHAPELGADESGLISVQEADSPLIHSEESETVAHAPELGADESGLISVQEVDAPLIPSEKSETVAHTPELAAKYNDLVSVQEVKSPLIPSKELETVAHTPELAANGFQEVESPLVPSEISENVAHALELATDASVTVQEAELPPILCEESESGETEREITQTSNMVGDGSLSRGTEREIPLTSSMTDDRTAGDGSLNRGTEREIPLTSSMTDDRTVAVVSGETPTPESISGPEEKTAFDVGGGTLAVQEVLSLPIPPVAEERESRERESKITETSRITRDGNSAIVSGLEEEAVVDVRDLVANGGDSESIQEAESPPVLAKELESKFTETESVETSSTIGDGNSILSGRTPTPVSDDDVEKIDQNTAEHREENLVSERPTRVAVLENAETKQIVEELDEGSSSTSTHSGFGSLLKYPHNIDGQIVSDSDEDAMDTDEEGGGKELFDSAALASLLRAATGASPDGSVSITSSDGTGIFSVDRPAGLGSSIPSLKPSPARPTQPNRATLLDHTIVAEPERIMDDEERKLHDKFEQIRVKFLLLVQRLGHSPDETEAAKVLYRLSLIEGIRIGKQTSQVFSFENAKKKALEYEMSGRDDLDFSCTILVIGKTGVGKSATVNSIFGQVMSRAHAFEKATTTVKEIVGIVHGVKIRVIDTPGLKASLMDQASNRRILSSIKKLTKRYPPDIVLYVDRMDIPSRSFNDLPLLKSITAALGSSIWLNTVVALTHAASAPPDGPSGYPLSYDMFVAQTSRAIQHSIGQAAGDFRLMNHVALVENHPSCRKNAKGESVLPNGLCWRTHMLLLCYSIKIISEANSLLKLQEPSPGKLFGFRLRSPPFAYFLASLLQSRPHPKLASAEGGDNGDSDVDLDDLIDADQEAEEDEYDELPPFKPLRNSQIAKLTKEQRRAYFDEYDYRVRLLQKKQWKEELRRLNEMKRKKDGHENFGYDDAAADFDQDNVPAIPVPMPDMSLPPSFDSDDTVYLYRSLEPTSQLVTRPVLEPHTWDHDIGYNYANIVQSLAVLSRYPAEVSVQLKKDKKDFYLHLDSSLSAKHGENASTLAGFDIQSIGKQLAYILRSDTKFKNLKKNKTGAGISITFLGETVATGLKIEDQLTVGKRVSLGARAGAVRAQGDVAYKTSLEATLRDKDYPFGQSIQTFGLSLTSWRGDLTLESDLQSQFSVGRNSKMSIHAGLNNKRSGQITIRTSSSEHPQLALVGIIPLAIALYRRIWPGDSKPY